MPAAKYTAFEMKLHAIALIDVAGRSLRKTAAAVGIAKSTIHDNLPKFRAEIENFQLWREKSEYELVRRVLLIMMGGKVSSRDCATMMNEIFRESVSHQTVLKILEKAAVVARKIDQQRLQPLGNIKAIGVDEIFQKQEPILGVIDLTSGYLRLGDYGSRSKESWTAFLEEMQVRGLDPVAATADGGQASLAGLKEVFPRALRIRDLFHLLQKLNRALRVVEGKCYGLISLNDNKKSKEIAGKMDKAIELYDQLNEQVTRLRDGMYFPEDGRYVSTSKAEKIIDDILHLLKSAIDLGIDHRTIRQARSYLGEGKGDILAYKSCIERLVREKFGPHLEDTVLAYLCPIVEALDQVQRVRESRKKREYWATRIAKLRCRFRSFTWVDQDEVDKAINAVVDILAVARRSNSLIEAVNSVIRRFLVTYKSVPNWFCSLFTFYWNHRRFKRGKRAGLKPVEVLSGKESAGSWVDQILDNYPFKATPMRA